MRKRWLLALTGLLVIVAALAFQGALNAATSLTTTLNIALGGTYSNALDLTTVSSPLNYAKATALANGTGLNQADRIFSDTRSTAVPEDLDVNASTLTDAFGATFTIAELKVLIVCAPTANTGNVILGGDAASVPFLSAATTTVTLKPGACFVYTDPSAAGTAVTAATGDIIQVAPSAGTQAYDIIIIGSSV